MLHIHTYTGWVVSVWYFPKCLFSLEDLGRIFPKDPMNQDLNSSDELVLCLHIGQRNNFTSLDTLLLITCHKNTWFIPFFLTESTKMPKVTQFYSNKIVFLHDQGELQRAVSLNLIYLNMVENVSFKRIWETWADGGQTKWKAYKYHQPQINRSTAICKTRWRLCHGLEFHFSQWCRGSCRNLWNFEQKRILIHHEIPCGKIIQNDFDPKHALSAVKACLHGKT